MECLNRCGSMLEVFYNDVEIDVCPVCIGVWLDDTELAEIVRSPERSWPPGVVEHVLEVTGKMGIPSAEFERVLDCPQCSEILDPVNYQANSGIITNTCQNGHGVWLDHGELAKVQIYMEHWRKITRDS